MGVRAKTKAGCRLRELSDTTGHRGAPNCRGPDAKAIYARISTTLDPTSFDCRVGCVFTAGCYECSRSPILETSSPLMDFILVPLVQRNSRRHPSSSSSLGDIFGMSDCRLRLTSADTSVDDMWRDASPIRMWSEDFGPRPCG